MKVEYEVKVGEAAIAGRAAARKWGVSGPLVFGLSIVAGVAAGWITTSIAGAVMDAINVAAAPRALVSLCVFLLTALPLLALIRRFLNLSYKRQIGRRGSTGPFPTSFELLDDHFRYVIGGITTTVPWAIVSEVFNTSGWWVLLAQGNSYYLPAKAFPAVVDERAFIAQVLQRMGAEARQRSQKAETFAAGAP